MKGIFLWVVAHPRASILATLLLAVGFAFGIPRVKIDSSATMLLVPGDPERAYYDEVCETFGDDVILSIVVKADDIFRSDVLQAVENLTADAEVLEGVTRVVSLTTVTNVRGQDGVLEVDELVPYVPSAEEKDEVARIRENALYNEILQGEVISEDGKTAAVNLFVADSSEDNYFNEKLTAAVQKLIDRELRELGPESGVEMYQAGVPKLKVGMIRNLRSDMNLLLPVSFIVIFAVLFLFYRSVAAVLIPALTGTLSVVITLGFMGFAGLDLTPVSLIIPMLLIVIGSTEDIHLISEYGLALTRGNDKEAAIRIMAEKGGLAVLLTSLTTTFGFATIMINEIPVLADFGAAATFGMVANFVVTVLMVPHLLRILPASRGLAWAELPAEDDPDANPEGRRGILPMAAVGIGRIVFRRRTTILVVSAMVMILGILAARRVVINTDYLSFFHEDDPVRQAFDDIGEHLAGVQSFYVVVDTGEEGGMKDPDNFGPVADLSHFVASKVDKVSGMTNLILKTHREITESEEKVRVLPDTPGLISQYALMLDQEDLDRFVNHDYSKTCFLVRTKMSGSQEIRGLLPQIEDYARSHLPPNLKVTITGEMILIASASDRIGEGIVLNLVLLLCAVLAVVSLLFFSIKAGLLAMIPNVIPVLITFAAMGVLGFELSPGTFSVAMIAFGIAVDDSIHFMVRYQKELKSGCAEEVAIQRSLTKEFRPIVASSMALVFGFLILVISDFGSIFQFGILAALSLTAALICDLFLTPALFLVSPLITAWDFMRLKISEQSLRESMLFQGLKLSETKRVALSGSVENFEADQDVVEEHAEGTDLFFVLNGRAKVITCGEDGVEQELEVLGSGSFFGEMALVTKEPRSATVRAMEPLEVIRIGEETLERIRRRHPRIAEKLFYNISRLLSERLRRTTHRA